MIKPTIGRIVYYNERGLLDPFPAIVVGVESDRYISALVFHSTFPHVQFVAAPLLQDDDEPDGNKWFAWMDYQKGQAAKTDAINEAIVGDLAKLGQELVALHKEIARLEQRVEGLTVRPQTGPKAPEKAKPDAQQEGGR